jgi:hypothetical protein
MRQQPTLKEPSAVPFGGSYYEVQMVKGREVALISFQSLKLNELFSLTLYSLPSVRSVR